MSSIKIVKDFVQGDSFKIKVSHNPTVDLTGAVFTFTLKSSDSVGSIPVLEVNHTIGDYVDDIPSLGLVYIPILAADTALIAPGKYYASIKRTLGSDVTTLVRTGKDNVDKVTVYSNLLG